ncbi:MAG: AMP-binding protein [Sphingomonas paucimobilis]
MLSALAQVPRPDGAGTSLRFVICGAAPLSAAQHAVAEHALGVPVLEGYGLTEGTCATSLNPAEDRRPGSIGRTLPGQLAQPMILDDDGVWKRDAAVGEVGVLALSGDNVFLGYRSAAHDRGIWIDHPDGRRWLNTGDLARIDADGYLWLTGRAKDLIIRGGHNIDPAVIEDALLRHPAVLLAAAVGRPDAHAGEVPVAFVQLRPGAEVDEATLLSFAESTIDERAARPKSVRVLPALPLTAVGKIFKPELRRLAADEVADEAN